MRQIAPGWAPANDRIDLGQASLVAIEPAEISKSRVLLTLFGGESVHGDFTSVGAQRGSGDRWETANTDSPHTGDRFAFPPAASEPGSSLRGGAIE